ncbi:nucleotidyltransferase domain-containing protein [Candidatus Babeliales bacterium]|nr:nucleotidyltransferase domain-containing protein [Candidatus Babeliales bacterium]
MKELDIKIKEKIIAIVHALVPEADIYLFGSRATGQHHARSDIDLALDAGKRLDRLAVAEVRELLEASNMPYHFDVVDVHNVGDDLKNDIRTEGVLWAKKK